MSVVSQSYCEEERALESISSHMYPTATDLGKPQILSPRITEPSLNAYVLDFFSSSPQEAEKLLRHFEQERDMIKFKRLSGHSKGNRLCREEVGTDGGGRREVRVEREQGD